MIGRALDSRMRNWSVRAKRVAMLPRWQTAAERWPISMSQMGLAPLTMQSRKLR